MDHLAVAGACLGSNGFGGIKHNHLAPCQRKAAGDREADHPGANYHTLDAIGHVVSILKAESCANLGIRAKP
jgi:hypothetical protein